MPPSRAKLAPKASANLAGTGSCQCAQGWQAAVGRSACQSGRQRTASASAAADKARRESAAKQVCRLTGSLVIRDARASLAQLCSALESGCTCVDVSGVDSIDTSGVQLLLAAAMEWRRREQSLTLTGYEHLIFGAAEQLGLQTLLPAERRSKTMNSPEPVAQPDENGDEFAAALNSQLGASCAVTWNSAQSRLMRP